MFWKILLLDVVVWILGILSLFFPIFLMQIYFLWFKKWYEQIPNSFPDKAHEFLLTLYSDPNSLDLKFIHSTERIRIGGIILIVSAIGLMYRLLN